MTLEGTVSNGVVVFDAGTHFPNGSRVRVELAPDDEDDFDPPPEPNDRESLLAALRESHEDALAGRVIPARQVLKEMALRHGIPLEPGE